MPQPTIETEGARERILAAASRLFYRDGFRAVGIDTIVAEAGVAKMSLYAHFPSKHHLIVAYLEKANAAFWEWLDGLTDAVTGPKDKLLAIFEGVGKLAGSPECLGCTFQAAASEFPDTSHAGHEVALAHKEAVRARFQSLAEEAGLRSPQTLADQLLLLMDGAWAAARMYGPENPSSHVADAARILIEAHSP